MSEHDRSPRMSPLDHWPVLRSGSREEVEQVLRSVYGAQAFSVARSGKPFFARANLKGLGAVSLTYCSYESPVQIVFPEAAFVRQAFCLGAGGSLSVGRHSHEIALHEAPVVAAGVPLDAQFGEGFQQILLRIDEAALAEKLAALTGRPARKLEFGARGDRSGAVRRLTLLLASELNVSGGRITPALRELEQALMVAFLFSNPNNLDALLRGTAAPVAPWQVRRAEEYIAANWERDLSVEELARAVGASARSIFASFRAARGYSPMAFVKALRLDRAREQLISGAPGVTVTSVALGTGFLNPGHFSESYRKRFGETPLETLKLNRGRSTLAARHASQQNFCTPDEEPAESRKRL